MSLHSPLHSTVNTAKLRRLLKEAALEIHEKADADFKGHVFWPDNEQPEDIIMKALQEALQ